MKEASHLANSRVLPGFSTPAVGFEAPFDMLEACHERVADRLALLKRLPIHLQANGCDSQARQAAADVLRYFDLAAPLHHQDEEIHVFPHLLASADRILVKAVMGLHLQHRVMEETWGRLRQALLAVATCENSAAEPCRVLAASAVLGFTVLYDDHIRLEEAVIYPAARRAMGTRQTQTMSADMMLRRGSAPQAVTLTPFQKATRLRIDSASGLGSG